MAIGIHQRSGRRGKRTKRTPMAEINVTPLVDVMLVLLIIFMVTAPLLTAAIPVNLPDSRATPAPQPQQAPLQISIDANGAVYIDKQLVSPSSLSARLASIAQDDANRSEPRQILLRADAKLDWQRIARVLGELNAAGLNRVGLVTTGSSDAP